MVNQPHGPAAHQGFEGIILAKTRRSELDDDAGWLVNGVRLDGHAIEQLEDTRIIRPRARYIGESDRRWVPLDER